MHVTGAHWYAENLRAKEAGPFLRELKDWVMETKHAPWDPGADIDEENNPILGYRERFVRDWPGPALPAGTDAVFPEGWRHAAVVARDDGGVQGSLLDTLDEEEREAFDRLAADRRGLALPSEGTRGGRGHRREVAPPAVGLGGRRHRLRPLPEALLLDVGAAAPTVLRTGRADRHRGPRLDRAPVHRAGSAPRARRRARPHLRGAGGPSPGKVDRLQQAFLASRFAGKVPLFAERAFLLRMEGFAVSGRIDAVFGGVGRGPWEVVDWKTGRAPAADDPLAGLQLDLYGLACIEVWGKRAEDLALTYLYLAGGEEVSHPMGDPDEVRARVSESLRSIGAGAFDPIPGRWCHALRLPVVLRGRPRLDGSRRRDRSVPRRRDSRRSICSENGR